MNKTLLLRLVFFFSFSIAVTEYVNAQLIGTNIFLKGTYVEVGINHCGAYGSGSLPPAGYHPSPFLPGLGFVADSDEDGWGTGTPAYCGDYFVPGSPVEGWGIQVGATTWYNTDQYCSPFSVPGSVTDYTYASGVYTGVWDGDVSSENLHITQTTTLPEDKAYFVTRILLCNEGATDLNDVYYMRNVDPDNDEPWSGDFTTDNIIVYQPPTDPDALVTSEGLTYGCFLGLGARDLNARVTWGNFSTTAGTPQQVWNGLVGYSLSGSSTGDIANSISIYIPTIPAGECKCIAFAYILNVDDLDEALEATTAVGVTADDIDITASGVTLICPGDSVNLEITNSEGYEWTWDPPTGLSTTTGDSVWASPAVTTDYVATGVGICGTLTRNVTVEVPLPPVADAGPDKFLCRGSSVGLDGSGGVTYEWQPPSYLDDVLVATPTCTDPLTNMVYSLIVADANGCKDTDQVNVTLYPDPVIDAGVDQLMIKGGFAQLNATGGVTYTWTPGATLNDSTIANPIATPEDTTMYYVTGIDENGCVGFDSVTVFVIDNITIVSPNAFTPNGDGLNDSYRPYMIGPGEIENFMVYDRWGKELFASNDINIRWDGTYGGKQQEVGTYIVYITAKNYLGEELKRSATLTLLR